MGIIDIKIEIIYKYDIRVDIIELDNTFLIDRKIKA